MVLWARIFLKLEVTFSANHHVKALSCYFRLEQTLSCSLFYLAQTLLVTQDGLRQQKEDTAWSPTDLDFHLDSCLSPLLSEVLDSDLLLSMLEAENT